MEFNNQVTAALKDFFIDNGITYKKLYREKRVAQTAIDGHSIKFFQLKGADFANSDTFVHLLRYALKAAGVPYLSVRITVEHMASGVSVIVTHSDEPIPLTQKYKVRKDMVRMIRNVAVYRIQALIALPGVSKGSIGGFVRAEHNLSHSGLCWISGDAVVLDTAVVSENAVVSGYAIVKGSACVRGNAQVFGECTVQQGAQIYDQAVVCMKAIITGYACIYGHARIAGEAEILYGARIHGDAYIAGTRRLVCDEDISTKDKNEKAESTVQARTGQ